MHDAALHRLEAVLDVGHGTLQYHIGRIVQKPVLIHARQLQLLVLGHLIGRVARRLVVTTLRVVASILIGQQLIHLVQIVVIVFHSVLLVDFYPINPQRYKKIATIGQKNDNWSQKLKFSILNSQFSIKKYYLCIRKS